MAFDYAALLVTVRTQIANFGRAVTFVQLDETPVDPAEPWKGATDPRAVPENSEVLNAVFVEPQAADRLGIGTVDVDKMRRVQKIAIVEPSIGSFDLKNVTELLDEGERFGVEFVTELRPASVTMLYFIGVRR